MRTRDERLDLRKTAEAKEAETVRDKGDIALDESQPKGKPTVSNGSSRRLAIRTRFCDDFFEDCVLSKGINQVRGAANCT